MRLSAGVALTQAQVDALQDDMVWAEEVVLDGTRVVVPRLYIAKSKRDSKASGLLAKNIHLEAESFDNNDSNIVGETVILHARSGDINNTKGGDIYASKHLDLEAARDINNVGSTVESGGTGSIHAGRHIKNITKSRRIGSDENHFTSIGKEASMKTKKKTVITSGGDLVNIAGSIKVGDLTFAIGGDFMNESIADKESTEILFQNGHNKRKSIVHKPATFISSGSTKGIVAGNFGIIGSRMSSAGDSSIRVGGSSFVIGQVDSDMLDSYSQSKTTGAFGNSKKHIDSHQHLKETLVEASVSAGGKNELIAGGDQVFQGGKFHGGKGTRLKGRKTSFLATKLHNFKSDFNYDEGVAFNTSDKTSQDSITNVLSLMSGGGKKVIESGSVEMDFVDTIKSNYEDDEFAMNSIVKQEKPAWMREIESNAKVKWNPLQDSSEYNDEHTQVLNAEFTALINPNCV